MSDPNDTTTMDAIGSMSDDERQNVFIKNNRQSIKTINKELHFKGGIVDRLNKHDKYLKPLVCFVGIVAAAFGAALLALLTAYFNGMIPKILAAAVSP